MVNALKKRKGAWGFIEPGTQGSHHKSYGSHEEGWKWVFSQYVRADKSFAVSNLPEHKSLRDFLIIGVLQKHRTQVDLFIYSLYYVGICFL